MTPLSKKSLDALSLIRKEGLNGVPLGEVSYQTLNSLRRRGLIHGWSETADGRYVIRISDAGRAACPAET